MQLYGIAEGASTTFRRRHSRPGGGPASTAWIGSHQHPAWKRQLPRGALRLPRFPHPPIRFGIRFGTRSAAVARSATPGTGPSRGPPPAGSPSLLPGPVPAAIARLPGPRDA
ncbi:hypothetical protein GCM10010392_23740 [Streptomyces clavifer]|nr:hypothetical protein GCM10010392_23740 [Streptomyces clavifer]